MAAAPPSIFTLPCCSLHLRLLLHEFCLCGGSPSECPSASTRRCARFVFHCMGRSRTDVGVQEIETFGGIGPALLEELRQGAE